MPEPVIRQKPSPGFGGIHDEEIIGPYELVDRVLVGRTLGYSNALIHRAIKDHTHRLREQGIIGSETLYGIPYVGFLNHLADLSKRKNEQTGRQA